MLRFHLQQKSGKATNQAIKFVESQLNSKNRPLNKQTFLSWLGEAVESADHSAPEDFLNSSWLIPENESLSGEKVRFKIKDFSKFFDILIII